MRTFFYIKKTNQWSVAGPFLAIEKIQGPSEVYLSFDYYYYFFNGRLALGLYIIGTIAPNDQT